MNAADGPHLAPTRGSDTESGLALETELALAEIISTAREAAPVLRFAVLPLDALGDLPIYDQLLRIQQRLQHYLWRALHRWAARCTRVAELDAHLLRLADELGTTGLRDLELLAGEAAFGDPQTLLVRAIDLGRRLGAARSGPAAIAFLGVLGRELDWLETFYRPTTLQRMDMAAAGRMTRAFFVAAQMPVVERRARTAVRNSRLPLDDLVQVGAEALIHATDRFDPSFGVPFAAYAHRWIKQRIARAERSADLIPLPLRLHEARSDVREAIANSSGGVATNTPMIATHLGLPERVVRAVLQAAAPVLSLDGVTGHILAETCADESGEGSEMQVTARERREAVARALATCPVRERAVLMQLFGIDCQPRSVEEVAKALRVSRQRVYQMRDAEIRRLRRPPVAKHLVAYA